jgi:hypothetical protein
MSYIRAVKRTEFHQESSTTSQVISTTQTELSGSRFSYTPENSANTVIVQISQNIFNQPDWDSSLEIILQESTDNFLSDVNNVSGSHIQIQSLGSSSNENNNGRDYWSFENQINMQGWSGKKYFRIVMKSDDTTEECTVQKTRLWGSSLTQDVYSPPNIQIREI